MGGPELPHTTFPALNSITFHLTSGCSTQVGERQQGYHFQCAQVAPCKKIKQLQLKKLSIKETVIDKLFGKAQLSTFPC